MRGEIWNMGGKFGIRVENFELGQKIMNEGGKNGLREENLECLGFETWNIWNEENLE